MSYKAMDLVYDLEIDDPQAKFVLLTIAKHADEKLQAYPSAARLASLTGLAQRTVQRKIIFLQKSGFLSVSNRRVKGRLTSNLYTIIRPKQLRQPVVELRQPVDLITSQRRSNISNNKSNNISSEKNENQKAEGVNSDDFWSGFLS